VTCSQIGDYVVSYCLVFTDFIANRGWGSFDSTTTTVRCLPQCSDGIDNDGDGKIDAADPACHSDGNAANPLSYEPNYDDETDPALPFCPILPYFSCIQVGGGYTCRDDCILQGVGYIGGSCDIGYFCHSPENCCCKCISPQCSDGIDNDGDGEIDAADPGCHSDGNAANPASYDPSDNDETDPALPFCTGEEGCQPTFNFCRNACLGDLGYFTGSCKAGYNCPGGCCCFCS
jgi:hypothetical protein